MYCFYDWSDDLYRKSRCKLFSLEECSDIEPISEDDEADKPICEVQVIS